MSWTYHRSENYEKTTGGNDGVEDEVNLSQKGVGSGPGCRKGRTRWELWKDKRWGWVEPITEGGERKPKFPFSITLPSLWLNECHFDDDDDQWPKWESQPVGRILHSIWATKALRLAKVDKGWRCQHTAFFLIMLMYDIDIGSKLAKTHFGVWSCLQSIFYIKVPFRVFAEQVSV